MEARVWIVRAALLLIGALWLLVLVYDGRPKGPFDSSLYWLGLVIFPASALLGDMCRVARPAWVWPFGFVLPFALWVFVSGLIVDPSPRWLVGEFLLLFWGLVIWAAAKAGELAGDEVVQLWSSRYHRVHRSDDAER